MPNAELRVRVTPRSSRNKLELEGEIVKVWTTASPTDGQANEAVCKLVAKTLAIAPTRVTVIRGSTSRDKTLKVEGVTLQEAMVRMRG